MYLTELKNIILYIRENYKNRKALQEEIDFFEETYIYNFRGLNK